MSIEKQYVKHFINEDETSKLPPEDLRRECFGRTFNIGDMVVRYGSSGSGIPTVGTPARIIEFRLEEPKSNEIREPVWKVKMINVDGNKATATLPLARYIILDRRGLE